METKYATYTGDQFLFFELKEVLKLKKQGLDRQTNKRESKIRKLISIHIIIKRSKSITSSDKKSKHTR